MLSVEDRATIAMLEINPTKLMMRRAFLGLSAALVFAPARRCHGSRDLPETRTGDAFFVTRGVVITPEDVTLGDWPDRARRAGLTTIALHPFPSTVVGFVRSDAGQQFLKRCRSLGLEVAYELHAMRELLPRDLFPNDSSLFRMDDLGERVGDANLCVHSARALDIAAENAVKVARSLQPTTGRYFFWGDDGQPWCRCPKCRGLSDSDQALLFENHLIYVDADYRRRYGEPEFIAEYGESLTAFQPKTPAGR
jgi:hypothetical protein